MALKLTTLSVIANGTYDFGSSPTQSYSYKIDGTFGGGTVEVGYLSVGGFVRYDAVPALTANGQGVVTCGNGSSIAFKVIGATAPVVFITVDTV